MIPIYRSDGTRLLLRADDKQSSFCKVVSRLCQVTFSNISAAGCSGADMAWLTAQHGLVQQPVTDRHASCSSLLEGGYSSTRCREIIGHASAQQMEKLDELSHRLSETSFCRKDRTGEPGQLIMLIFLCLCHGDVIRHVLTVLHDHLLILVRVCAATMLSSSNALWSGA